MEVECQSLFHWQESLAAVLLFTLKGLEMPRVDWAQRKQCSALNWQWELNPSASKRAAVGHGHRGSGSISLILCLQRLPCKKEEKTDERKRLSWANATLCGDLKMSREGIQSIKPQLCAIGAIVLRLIQLDQLAYFRTQCGDRSAFATFFGNFDSDYHQMRHFNNSSSVARHMWKQEFDRIP